jgi:hypothetical protein
VFPRLPIRYLRQRNSAPFCKAPQLDVGGRVLEQEQMSVGVFGNSARTVVELRSEGCTRRVADEKLIVYGE